MSDNKEIKEAVNSTYTAIAESQGCGCGCGSCGTADPLEAAEQIGYSAND